MDTALVVAIISGVVALVSAGFSGWTQFQLAKRERESKAAERRSEAKVVLDRYRGPLLDAAWQLGDRLDNIRNRGFSAYYLSGGREQDAKLTTLFRFAHYLGWREFIRTEVQLLRFEDQADTRLAAAFLNDVTSMLASDQLGGTWGMVWGDEQRGIGELMADQPVEARAKVRGHAAFRADYDKIFKPWMARFADDLFSPPALTSDRLRFLQWALYGLVRKLDEAHVYGGSWIDQSAKEASQPIPQGSASKQVDQVIHVKRLRQHLAELDQPTPSLSGKLHALLTCSGWALNCLCRPPTSAVVR